MISTMETKRLRLCTDIDLGEECVQTVMKHGMSLNQ